MFKRILVPLDGSQLAESALPAAEYIAGKTRARVLLIHVIEQHPPAEVHGQHHLANEAEALAYLDGVIKRYFDKHGRAESHVHTAAVSDVAASIVDHANEIDSDLIVMCTHGRSGLREWLFGNIAQQVIAIGSASVLLIRPAAAGEIPPFTCHRLLVALDGQAEHERGLAVAAELASACKGDLVLLTAIPTLDTLPGERSAGKLLPGTMTTLLDLSEEDARSYLDRHVQQLAARKITATAAVGRGNPADVIVQTAASVQADIIVLGTHGKKGMDAFWEGSTTPKVSSRSKSPLLLVPVR